MDALCSKGGGGVEDRILDGPAAGREGLQWQKMSSRRARPGVGPHRGSDLVGSQYAGAKCVEQGQAVPRVCGGVTGVPRS